MAEPAKQLSREVPNGFLGHLRANYVAYALATVLAVYTGAVTEDRFTGRDAERFGSRLSDLEREVQSLPPRELLERVQRLEIESSLVRELKAESERLRREIETLRAVVIRVEAKIHNGSPPPR